MRREECTSVMPDPKRLGGACVGVRVCETVAIPIGPRGGRSSAGGPSSPARGRMQGRRAEGRNAVAVELTDMLVNAPIQAGQTQTDRSVSGKHREYALAIFVLEDLLVE